MSTYQYFLLATYVHTSFNCRDTGSHAIYTSMPIDSCTGSGTNHFAAFDQSNANECTSSSSLLGFGDAVGGVLQQRLLIWGLFLRGIGFVLCLSYVSISFQIVPLAGKNGVTPIALFLKALKEDVPSSVKRFFKFPTIFWLLGSSDLVLRMSVACGFFATLAAVIGIGGEYNTILFAIGWAIYLSLNYAIGLTFPWDAFLLEASFLNIFSCRHWCR